MTPEKRKELGELLQRFFREAGDTEGTIYKEEREIWRAKRDAPTPRLKVTPKRMGGFISRADDEIFPRMAELQAKGKTNSQIKQVIMTEFSMSNDTYHRLIDASSDCSDPRNASLMTPDNGDQASGGGSWLTGLFGRKPR